MLRSWLGVPRRLVPAFLLAAITLVLLGRALAQGAPTGPGSLSTSSSASATPPQKEEAPATQKKLDSDAPQSKPEQAQPGAAKPRTDGEPKPSKASKHDNERSSGASKGDASGASSKGAEDAAARQAAGRKKLAALAKRPGRVIIIPIHDMIDLGLAPFVRRAMAEQGDVSLVVLDVNTFGGRVDAAVKIRDALLESKIPTLAFINRRAISAGALISLAADTIIFSPGGTMGAATPVQIEGGTAKPVAEKMVSYMRSEMRSTAQAKGRDGKIAEAMVDADVEIPKLTAKGKLLTLTTTTATETGISTAIANSLDECLELAGLKSRPRAYAKASVGEKLARFLTDPTVAGLLMSLGMLGLMIELYSPGFGAPGIIGITSLALFFGGHWFAALAGVEELVLALIGLGLLAVEIFVIPGFGWAGIAGILCLVASLTLSMVGVSFQTAWHTGALTGALGTVLLAFLGSVAAMAVIILALRRAGRLGQYSTGGWFVLNRTLAHAKSAQAADARTSSEPYAELLGVAGIALTDLRPSGKARIGQETCDVVSSLEYISRGAPVRVTAVEGSRIVVDRTEEQ